MADAKISQLTSLAGNAIDPAADLLPIVDTSATTTKKCTPNALKQGMSLNLVDNTADADKPISEDTQAALDLKIETSVLDTDGTLAANSDAKIATQKAVKTYVDGIVTGLLDFKGSTDCSGNPNYPSALKGDAYVVSVAGKIGGASGTAVDVGDVYVAKADNAGGTQAGVGSNWFLLEHNLAGALLAANNLSDLANAATARTNLGLGNVDNTSNATERAASATLTNKTLGSGCVVPWEKQIACSDLVTDITSGTTKAYFRMPCAVTLTAVRASVSDAPTGSTIIIDINEAGSTILSTKLSIDAGEKTSTTAATPAVISDAALADDAEITIDFDQVGGSNPGKGVEVTLIGTRTL